MKSNGCLWIILLALAGIFLGPLLLMWVWNWVAVDLFSSPVITYWQAFGLEWLSYLLFGRHITVSRS